MIRVEKLPQSDLYKVSFVFSAQPGHQVALTGSFNDWEPAQMIMEYQEDDVMKLYGKDMEGLNVLAFGDSLFSGTIGYDQKTQWVNKLGLDCKWNLTNLGIGSMTVSSGSATLETTI